MSPADDVLQAEEDVGTRCVCQYEASCRCLGVCVPLGSRYMAAHALYRLNLQVLEVVAVVKYPRKSLVSRDQTV